MAIKKTAINYPTQEWLDQWIDRYCDQHPDERITDFEALKEQAEEAWWMNEMDHDRPTPFDLTPEQSRTAGRLHLAGRGVQRDPHGSPPAQGEVTATPPQQWGGASFWRRVGGPTRRIYARTQPHEKKDQKTFEKGVDIRSRMWYYNHVRRGAHPTERTRAGGVAHQAPKAKAGWPGNEKNFKKGLTNGPKRAILSTYSRGAEPHKRRKR